MNPVLIKPEADARSQIVVLGKPWKTISAWEYYQHTPTLWEIVKKSFERLCSSYDLIIIEGAGSPAEINLRRFEIVNMKVAELAKAPVLLVGDIDKGGVFASLVGTLVLLEKEEQERIKGFIINKFRGDISILKPGLDILENLTKRPVLGVVPYYHNIIINEEDSIYTEIEQKSERGVIDIAVIHFPRISNSTDFEPLQQEGGVRLRYVSARWELGNPDLIILPGTKNTIADLAYLKESGLAESIIKLSKKGMPVIGICGGYQMLGKKIEDPLHTESREESVPGLGLLDLITVFEPSKTTTQVSAETNCNKGLLEGLEGKKIVGYEIHMGQSERGNDIPAFRILKKGLDKSNPLLKLNYFDGSLGEDGNILGTYIHGLFDSVEFRKSFLSVLRRRKGLPEVQEDWIPTKEEQYDKLADVARSNLDVNLIRVIAGLP
jgi:adenosylcobyric acid synthase